MRTSRRFILLIALFSAPLFAAEELVEEFVSVNYKLAWQYPTKEESAAAEVLAREKAVVAALDGEANMALKSLVEKYDLMEDILADHVKCVPGFTVTASRVIDNQLQLKAAVKINLREIGTLVRKHSQTDAEKAKDEGMFVLYLAREAASVMSYDDRRVEKTEQTVESQGVWKQSENATTKSLDIAPNRDGDAEFTHTKTSGGATEIKIDRLRYEAKSTDTLTADAGSVFSNRGFELYQAADLDLDVDLLEKIPELWASTNKLPLREIGALREQLKSDESIRYFVLCWLEAGQVDFDKDVRQERCVVKASAEVVDLKATGKRGKTIFNTEAVLSRGFGENQTLAKENAMKTAAKETAVRVASGILQKITGN